jgi:hypothetical protein
MAGFSSLLTVAGLGVSLAGSFMQASAQQTMAREQRDASLKAENARQQQTQLDASRRRRTAVREMLMARSSALATGTAQGAGQGSGVAGAMAQATATGFQTQQTVTAAEELGVRGHQANRDYAKATAKGQIGMAQGSMISSLGGAMMSMSGTIGRLGNYATGNEPTAPNYNS